LRAEGPAPALEKILKVFDRVIIAQMERRKHLRVPLSANVQLHLEEGERPLIRRGMVSAVSLGGIGLYLVQPVESGSRVTLENRFMAAGGEIMTETVKGTAVYSKYLRDIYLVGIEFAQELSPNLQPHLYGHIQDTLKQY
jgi:hypothetical protein